VLTLMLLDRRTGNPWVFPGKIAGQPLSEFNRSYERIASRSGVDFTPHDLRRTFSSMAQVAGVDKEMIRKLLNHQDKDVTDGYIIYWSDRYKEPLQKIEDCILTYGRVK